MLNGEPSVLPLPFAVEQLLFQNDALPVIKVRLCAFVTEMISGRT
jgi:hypothetical protein